MESSEILQHIQEQIDMILEVRSENNIEVLGSLYKDIVKMRHELFGSWLCKENNIPYVGDTRIKDFIINNLDEGIKKRLFKKTKTYNNTKYSNKTPDLLIIDSDRLWIIDFSVRNKSVYSFKSKLEKYQIYEEDLRGIFNVKIMILNYSPETRNIQSTYSDHDNPLDNRPDFVYRDIIEETEELKVRIMEGLSLSERASFEQLIYSEDTDFHAEGMGIDFDFKVNEEEFNVFLLRHKETIDKINEEFGIDIVDDFKNEIDRCSFDSVKEKLNSSWEHYERKYNEFREQVKEHITLNPPKAPEYELINTSLEKMEGKAKDHFLHIMDPKMLSNIPVINPEFKDKSDANGSAKYKRLFRLSQIVSECNLNEFSFLKDILQFHKISNDQYELLKEEGHSLIDGQIIKKDLEEKYNRKGLIDEKTMLKCKESVMEFGRNEQIKVNTQINKESRAMMLEGCGVGLKKKIKKDGVIKKVKSLPFWDEELSNSYMNDMNKMLDEIKSSFQIRGGSSELNVEKELEEKIEGMTRSVFSAASSSSDEEGEKKKEDIIKRVFNKLSFTKYKPKKTDNVEKYERNHKETMDTLKGILRFLRDVEVLYENLELDDLMKNTEAERPEYDVIPDMDISHFILRSRPLPLNSYEGGVCRMGSILLALYMQSIMSIDDIMGRVSVTERNVIRRGIELMCMHANLFSYSQYLIALGEDVKAYTDELYTYVKDFFEEGRDRMRLEFAVLEKFIDMAKHEALLAGKKDKDMLEAFGFVGAKKLIPRKVRSVDIRAKRMNRMAKSSDDVINPEAIMKVSMAASTEGETSTYESDKNVLEEFENVRQKKLNKKQRMREKKKKELEPTKEEDNLQDVDLLDRLLAKVKPIQETDIVENMEEFSQGFSAIDIDLDAELGGLDDDVIDESILEVSAL